MPLKKINYVAVLCFLFAAAFCATAHATITIESNGKGTLIITDPNATDPDKLITMIELGKQPIPPIPNGAILEVFDGEFTVTVSGGESVDITVLDHEMTLQEGNTVHIVSGESAGSVEMTAGSGTLVNPVGEEIPLKQGETYPLKVTELNEEEKVEALEPAGVVAGDNAPPVDSRSMESSPSA
jgi:hypothetical protein